MGQRVAIAASTVALMLCLANATALAAPSHDAPLPMTTIQALLVEAQQILQPVINQHHLAFRLQATGRTPIDASQAESVRERVLNLVANAVAMAPEKTEVTVTLDPEASALTIWVGDQRVALTLDREVRDCIGSTFHLRSQQGKGTWLSEHLLDVRVGQAP